jgi:hypothetical protein
MFSFLYLRSGGFKNRYILDYNPLAIIITYNAVKLKHWVVIVSVVVMVAAGSDVAQAAVMMIFYISVFSLTNVALSIITGFFNSRIKVRTNFVFNPCFNLQASVCTLGLQFK